MNRFTDDDWALLIGRCMMEFGRMEQDVNILWMRWNPHTSNPEGYKAVELDARAKQVIEFADLRAAELGVNNRKTLIHNLNAVIQAFILRHLIAHNPVGIEVYEDAPTEAESFLKDVIIGMRDKTKRIDFKQLSKVFGNLRELRIIMGYNALHAMGLRMIGDKEAEPHKIPLERFDKGATAFKCW